MSISWPFFWAALKKAAWFVWHLGAIAKVCGLQIRDDVQSVQYFQMPPAAILLPFHWKICRSEPVKADVAPAKPMPMSMPMSLHKLRLDRGSCCGLQPEASSSSCKFKSNGKLLVHRDFTHWCQRVRRSKSWISFSGAACRRPNSRRHKVPGDFAAERVVQPLIPYCQQYYARHAPLVRSMAGY